MSLNITGVALVTGAGSGIGQDCAWAYAAEGARAVVFADINETASIASLERSKSLATNPSYRGLALRVDVSDSASVDALVERTISEFGRIDYCVNSAGVGVQQPAEIAEGSLDEYERFWAVNVRGVLHCLKAVTQVMKKQIPNTVPGRLGPRDTGRGVIINMGSCNSYIATRHIAQYTMSKHAVLGLTRNAALDNASYGIRVNTVCPSWIETPMVEAAVKADAALGDMIERAVPVGRMGTTEEVSDVVMFLSSPRASYVTGAGWIVDGGTTLQLQT